MTIEEKIRAKKEEIKKANRELSKLQDEARAKNEPMTIHISHSSIGLATEKDPRGRVYNFDCKIVSNKQDLNNVVFLNKVQKAIESLSEKNDEPKSYVDWDKIPKEYNWASIDAIPNNPGNGVYRSKPSIVNDYWTNYCDYTRIPFNAFITNDLPAWDKSLIHRPGIKE